MEQWIVTILDTCNEFTRFCDTKRKREEGTSMTKESRGIDNVSLKCFIVGRCRSGRSSNRFPFFSSSPLLPFLKATLRRGNCLPSSRQMTNQCVVYEGKMEVFTSNTYEDRSSIRLFLLKYMVPFVKKKKMNS